MNIEGLTPLLNVEDVARSMQFYRDRLGFHVTGEWTDAGRVRWASLHSSGVRIMLNEAPETDSPGRRRRCSYSDVVFYFITDDVDSLHVRLKQAGIAVGELANEDYGMREFYVRDPDGYELGFGTPLPEGPKGAYAGNDSELPECCKQE